MENHKEKSPVIRYWPQLLILCVVCISVGKSLNSMDSVWQSITATEKEHQHDVDVLNDEDDGVRGDFERADECNREIAKLENEILYWKLKYEASSNK